MVSKTVLYDCHQKAGARWVEFAGWQMPLHYGSQLQEHRCVREDVGIFDVSHMMLVDITGVGATDYLRYLLANDVARLMVGKALYSCMLNETGGVKDDLIVYMLSESHYRIVLNAATREKCLAWMNEQVGKFQVQIKELKEFVILAIQGPNAKGEVSQLLHEISETLQALKPFHSFMHNQWLIACTGYTGEDGLEIILPAAEARKLWQSIVKAGVQPCGLAARDTLRLEAGYNLYGADMDENTGPLISNLAWTIAWQPQERDFIGRAALEQQKAQGVAQCLVGLVLQQPGVLRHGQKVIVNDVAVGVVTSGSFSPTLNCSIALARVPIDVKSHCLVEMRSKLIPVQVGKPAFVRNGNNIFKIANENEAPS